MMHPPPPKISVSINSSAAVIAGNDDLLTEVLLFVPAKSLIRFKLVSKRWRTLISSASFSRHHTLHHHRRPDPHHSFILRRSKSQHFVCHPTAKRLVPFQFPFPSVKILQSCNGLLLLEGRTSRLTLKLYYVFNPTTKQSREFYLSKPTTGIYLMFDPSKSEHYRILCVGREGNSTRFSVYDSQTHEWKETATAASLDEKYSFRDGVYCNGSMYFIRYGRRSSFRCSSEEIEIIPNPPLTGNYAGKKNCIMESNGHLHFVRLSTWPWKGIWNVYEMVDDEWVIMDENRQLKAGNESKMDLIGMMRGEKVEDSVLLYHVPGKIRIYRFLDSADEVLVDFTRDDFYQERRLQFQFQDAHSFIPVLTPV